MKSAHKKAQNATGLCMYSLKNILVWIKAGEPDSKILEKIKITQENIDKLRKIYKHY